MSVTKLPTITVGNVGDEEAVVRDGEDEKAVSEPESLDRPISFVSAVFVGMGMCLVIVLLFGFATANLIIECLLDGNWMRLAFIALIPLLALVGLFLWVLVPSLPNNNRSNYQLSLITVFTDLFEMFGPIGGVSTNSRSFSGRKPSLRRAYQDGFQPPHITIQMPVYKEGLQGVIIPTVNSLKAAISYYESRGGRLSIVHQLPQRAKD
jgi:hypothetical protein